MNLVMKETLPSEPLQVHPFQSQASSSTTLDPIPKKGKQGFKTESRGQRIFGKELQNRAFEDPILKERQTPSTQNSLSGSEKKLQKHKTDVSRKDPQSVEAYRNRIRSYLARKDKTHRVASKYLNFQKNINGKMRGILVDWLVDVSVKFKLIPQTLFSAVNLLDRYLEKSQVARQKLQLIGVSCLMVVSKFEEIYPPSVRDYVSVCDQAYSQEEILDTEADILQVLQFDLAMTPSFIFYKEITSTLGLSVKSERFGSYLLETALLEASSLRFSNRELACGATFLVNKIFKCKKTWEKDLSIRMAGINESKVKSCAKELYKILTAIGTSELTAVKRKFSTVENYEVSKYKIERSSKSKSKRIKSKVSN